MYSLNTKLSVIERARNYRFVLGTFTQYADEQPPETAVAFYGGISEPYTHLKKTRDEGKQLCCLPCYVRLYMFYYYA